MGTRKATRMEMQKQHMWRDLPHKKRTREAHSVPPSPPGEENNKQHHQSGNNKARQKKTATRRNTPRKQIYIQ